MQNIPNIPTFQERISVVAPMYNEQEVIRDYIELTYKVLDTHFQQFELILVDDGSSDDTLLIAKALADKYKNIHIIAFTRNYGHEIASTAGLEASKGDYVILMDTDLQHPPETILGLVEKAKEGFEVVYAERANRDADSWLHKKLAQAFYAFARKMTGYDINSNAGNFRLMSRRVIDSLLQFRESNRHLLMLFAYVGFDSASVPFECCARKAGKTKYSYRKLANLAIDSIISFSHRPLRYMSILSVFISFCLTGYAGYIVIEKLFFQQSLAAGVASVIFITSGLFAILFLFLAIMSEYISRILIESKHRPLYYIKQTYSSREHDFR